jgi:uncharacterized membrane protein
MPNYRPNIITNVLFKIFEKPICTRIYQHLIDNILVDGKRGFRINFYTAEATHKVLIAIPNALSSKK